MSGRRYASNLDLRAAESKQRIVGASVMASIVNEDRTRRNGKKRAADPDLLEVGLMKEVGPNTAPVRIYRPDPVTGELVLKETLQAQAFRDRALRSPEGQRVQARIALMTKKRLKAAAISKAKARRGYEIKVRSRG